MLYPGIVDMWRWRQTAFPSRFLYVFSHRISRMRTCTHHTDMLTVSATEDTSWHFTISPTFRQYFLLISLTLRQYFLLISM